MRAEVAQGSSNVALAWLGAMGQNLATSVLPAADLTTRSASSIPESLYLYATGVYFNSLTGALTLALTAFLVIHVIRRHMRGAQPSNRPLPCEATERCAFWLFVILGCLGAVALHPRPSVHGLAHNAFFTSAVLLVGLAWTTLARAPRRWIHVVGAGMMLEFLAMFWSHVWFTAAPNFLDCTGYNASAKQEESYVFLRDFLGGYYPLAVATAIGIQLALAVLLVRAARRLPIVERETPPLQAAQTDNA
jgi:hypothetical protein